MNLIFRWWTLENPPIECYKWDIILRMKNWWFSFVLLPFSSLATYHSNFSLFSFYIQWQYFFQNSTSLALYRKREGRKNIFFWIDAAGLREPKLKGQMIMLRGPIDLCFNSRPGQVLLKELINLTLYPLLQSWGPWESISNRNHRVMNWQNQRTSSPILFQQFIFYWCDILNYF